MVKLIAGTKGSGKSKEMIKLANEELKKTKGNIIFLDDDDRNIFDLDHDIRFIDVTEYEVTNTDSFVGFLNGMLSRDYDINAIFVDGLLKMIDISTEEMEPLFETISTMSNKHEVKFYLTASHPITELPNKLEKYLY